MNTASGRVVGVVDCGSASIRASIAEVRGRRELHLLDEVQRHVDLDHAFRLGRMRRPAMDQVVEALVGIRRVMSDYGVQELRAVGTSVWREAGNTDGLLERIAATCGFEVEIIDGAELARLYYEALLSVLQREERRLSGSVVLADLGSGATVIGLIRRGKLAQAVEERFGTLRMLQEFRPLRDSLDLGNAIGRFAHGAAAMMMRRLYRCRIRHLVVTGTEIRQLLARLHPGGTGLLGRLERSEIEGWLAALEGLPLAGVAERLACGPDQAASLLLGAHLLRHLCIESDSSAALVPKLNLRDGLLADMLVGAPGPHQLDRGNLLEAARQIARRFGVNPAYAENTRSLAAQIYDQTGDLHHLGQRERTLLEMAALLHDIGSFVNARSRHKHSHYLIQSTDIAGLSALEQSIVAQVARYHRRSTPRRTHRDFRESPRHARVVVVQLAAILRLAYALDVERTQRIKRVVCRRDGDRLVLQVDRRQIALERWSVAQKSGMFTDHFGVEVVLLGMEA